MLAVVLAVTVLAAGVLIAKAIGIFFTRRVFLASGLVGNLLEAALLLASTGWLVNFYGAASVFADEGEAVSFLPVRQVRDTGHGVIDLVSEWIAPTVTVLFTASGICLVAVVGAILRHRGHRQSLL
ncbi:hypothetical protein ACH4OW_31700 [Streptomyces sp. NPDC017056]|uniref:hypothetical protein n=1 Tax=Streptomyces sp. NPDC017056 TaxID=3364973 RepID=UPI0037879D06